MIRMNNDYSEGCHPAILQRLVKENYSQQPGYGEDEICRSAAEKIRVLCGRNDLDVHFLVGGTQTNFTVIAAALRPHQGVLSADSGHINCHETGAVEATGHKVLPLPSTDGKITAEQIRTAVLAHRADGSREHLVQPKMVYISQPTEWGTLYSRRELEEIHEVCVKLGVYLFVDGARLAYALGSDENDVSLSELARLTDVFYIGGTKAGALLGEAVVIANPELKPDFRYAIKQHGGMLAKGWLLGMQFDVLMEGDRYAGLGRPADRQADKIRRTLRSLGIPFRVETATNQIFPVFPEKALKRLSEEFVFSPMDRVDGEHRVVRICTSWATPEENVDALCRALTSVFSET